MEEIEAPGEKDHEAGEKQKEEVKEVKEKEKKKEKRKKRARSPSSTSRSSTSSSEVKRKAVDQKVMFGGSGLDPRPEEGSQSSPTKGSEIRPEVSKQQRVNYIRGSLGQPATRRHGHAHPKSEVVGSADHWPRLDICPTIRTPSERRSRIVVKARAPDCHHGAARRGTSASGRSVVVEGRREGVKQRRMSGERKRKREEGKGEGLRDNDRRDLQPEVTGVSNPVALGKLVKSSSMSMTGLKCPGIQPETRGAGPVDDTTSMTAGAGPDRPHGGATKTGALALRNRGGCIIPAAGAYEFSQRDIKWPGARQHPLGP